MKLLGRHAFSATFLGCMLFVSSLALASENDVVLSLQQNPAEEEGLEAACVALQLATFMLEYENPTGDPTMAPEADTVTIFATLDGVYIADEGTYEDDGKHKKKGKKGKRGKRDDDEEPMCQTPGADGLGTEPLRDVLDDFFHAGGKVLLCPLCYAARQDGDYVLIEDPMYFDEPQILIKSPIPLLLEADKVIDY